VLSVASQFISEGLGLALAHLLHFGHKVPKFKLTEITLDDNGLKDDSFAQILNAVADSGIQIINYNNNGLGAKSIEQIKKILKKKGADSLKEFRISNIRANKIVLSSLFEALEE
jgi:hypothetical protein